MDLDRGYYALWALFVYGVFLLYLLAPVPGKRPVVPVCACVVTLCLSALLTAKTVQRQDLALTVLDVGQGQSVVVTLGHARALIDCGGPRDPGDTAATYLQSLGRSELDLLILTHFHADHAGGVLELMDRVKVRALAVPDVDRDNPLRQEITARAAAENIPVYYVTETSQVTLGRAEITLYPPVTAGKDANEQCLSVLCARKGGEALLTGDMPAAAEAKLVARENLPEVEVLVAGHHGSKQSTSQALLEAVAPETVVISVGQNTYGHPAPEPLARLSAAGAQVYRTDRQGGLTGYAQSGAGGLPAVQEGTCPGDLGLSVHLSWGGGLSPGLLFGPDEGQTDSRRDGELQLPSPAGQDPHRPAAGGDGGCPAHDEPAHLGGGQRL